MEHAVLVLNANYEPINVCNFHRALGLMLTDKASLILNGRGVVHTAQAEFPIPSIIRLQKMIHAPHPHVRLSRREILRRDHFTCQYCGKLSGALIIDHVLPRHLGGAHTWTNVVAACSSCNHRKGGMSLNDSGMTLITTPKEPPHSANYIFGHYLADNQEWENFLKGW